MISPARAAAFRILSLVEDGGYASDLLVSHTEAMDSRDAGLASEIVFGCLRRQAQLDYIIGLSARGKLDRAVEGQRLLNRCLEKNPGTPWAFLAARELEHPLSVDFNWRYVPPPPPSPPGRGGSSGGTISIPKL